MLDDLARRGLKAIVGLGVRMAGGQVNAANISGRIDRAATFSDYANSALADRHCPIDVAVEIDEFNGKPLIVAKMADMLGYRLEPLPGAKAIGSTAGALARSIKEGAEAIAAISEMLDIGVKHSVKPTARREIDEAIEAFHEVRRRLDAIETEARE